MFSKVFVRDDKIREWSRMVERYIALHKYLKDVGKISIAQARSGQVKDDVQVKLIEALDQTDKALKQLKEFFKPCLPDGNRGNEEGREIYNETLENQILELQDRVFQKQQEFELQRQQLLEENFSLRHNLTENEKNLLKLDEDVPDSNTKGYFNEATLKIERKFSTSEENLDVQTETKRKLMQFEETLKTQNDLIEDLKQQLSDSNKERETVRHLNTILEGELQKQSRKASVDEVESKAPQLPDDEETPTVRLLKETLKLREEELESSRIENLMLRQDILQLKMDNVPEVADNQVEQLKLLLLDANYERDILRFENEDLQEQLLQLTRLDEEAKAPNSVGDTQQAPVGSEEEHQKVVAKIAD